MLRPMLEGDAHMAGSTASVAVDDDIDAELKISDARAAADKAAAALLQEVAEEERRKQQRRDKKRNKKRRTKMRRQIDPTTGNTESTPSYAESQAVASVCYRKCSTPSVCQGSR